MTQRKRVIDYINLFGSITPLDAFRDLGITKLATVISSMKRDGFIVYQSWETSKNRWGENCHYMRYWLNKEKYEHDLLFEYDLDKVPTENEINKVYNYFLKEAK